MFFGLIPDEIEGYEPQTRIIRGPFLVAGAAIAVAGLSVGGFGGGLVFILGAFLSCGKIEANYS